MRNETIHFYRYKFGPLQPLSTIELNELFLYIPDLLKMPFVYFSGKESDYLNAELIISANDLKTILYKTIHDSVN